MLATVKRKLFVIAHAHKAHARKMRGDKRVKAH
jgi:hypothetical protein